MAASFYVKAIWDAEARVWISETDIPGLVIEADSLSEFEALVSELAPELLADNLNIHNANVPVTFSAESRLELRVA